ncbi:hypothetical protein NBRC111894_860 [Sporolactobacillus inulinus]|uniref:Uncharacterized protein n=1 Tax=Sporolactobacillus inulinus TaxID=2078 RepID=A0A4Y1Z8K5_9BACL|nr:hypothetical protein NBRC111894_860 [Sporolactobacillus inulinus]
MLSSPKHIYSLAIFHLSAEVLIIIESKSKPKRTCNAN